MASFDWRHLVAAVVGVVLGIVGSYLGIDFSKSCPSAPSAAVSVPVAK